MALGQMKLLGLIFLSVIAYVAITLMMDYGLGVAPESQWYLASYAASLLVLGFGLFSGFRGTSKSRLFILVAILASGTLVLGLDIIAAVVYSCAQGVCL